MYRPVLVTPPAVALISRSEAKVHCRIDHDDDNETIDALISAAMSYADGWTGILGRCLVEQTWRQDFDDIWGCLRIPLFPVISISSVKYRDTQNVEQTISSSNYTLQTDDLGSFARFLSNYSAPALYTELPRVSLTYKAGYANGGTEQAPTLGAVPGAIKQALLMLIAHWYENREAVTMGAPVVLPMAVESLLSPFRRIKF